MANFQRLARAFGQNVYRSRRNWRLNQEDFAKLCNMPRSTLSQIERGEGNPSLQSLTQISEALHISVNDLISTRKHYAWEILGSEIKKESHDDGRVKVSHLLPINASTIELRHIEIAEFGKIKNLPKSEFSKEFLTVMAGQIFLRLENSSTLLKAGESVHFRGDQNYIYENVGDNDSFLIAANIPVANFITANN